MAEEIGVRRIPELEGEPTVAELQQAIKEEGLFQVAQQYGKSLAGLDAIRIAYDIEVSSSGDRDRRPETLRRPSSLPPFLTSLIVTVLASAGVFLASYGYTMRRASKVTPLVRSDLAFANAVGNAVVWAVPILIVSYIAVRMQRRSDR